MKSALGTLLMLAVVGLLTAGGLRFSSHANGDGAAKVSLPLASPSALPGKSHERERGQGDAPLAALPAHPSQNVDTGFAPRDPSAQYEGRIASADPLRVAPKTSPPA